MEQAWVESILEQCREHEVAFFFKQWGGVQKHRNGRELNGRTYDEMPIIPGQRYAPTMSAPSRSVIQQPLPL